MKTSIFQKTKALLIAIVILGVMVLGFSSCSPSYYPATGYYDGGYGYYPNYYGYYGYGYYGYYGNYSRYRVYNNRGYYDNRGRRVYTVPPARGQRVTVPRGNRNTPSRSYSAPSRSSSAQSRTFSAPGRSFSAPRGGRGGRR